MNPLIQLKTTPLLLIAFVLACLALSPRAQALLPPPAPDGGYPEGNTAEGTNALFNLTSGINNTAVGVNALTHNATGGYNVAVGSWALRSNITGSFNLAIGSGALRDSTASYNSAIGFRVGFMNTTGNHLTGIGAGALLHNTTGSNNTAIGADALSSNTTGFQNTAIGTGALLNNTTGDGNTANGVNALWHNNASRQTAVGQDALVGNTSGQENVAVGYRALAGNTTGGGSVAVGYQALDQATGGAGNTAVGDNALRGVTTGDLNTAIGHLAGIAQTTGFGNVYIGAFVTGDVGESNHTYIRNIYSTNVGAARVVRVLPNGLLGTLEASSRRFKDDIKPMDKASEVILALKPVTFRYKKEMDPQGSLMFGLVAEEVEEVIPELVTRDEKGQIDGVRYEMINAMLLNEFLKEHRKNEEQGATIECLQRQVDALSATLQKVSAQLEVSKAKPQMAENNQ